MVMNGEGLLEKSILDFFLKGIVDNAILLFIGRIRERERERERGETFL